MRSAAIVVWVVCLLVATGCDEKSPTGPTVGLNREFTLAPGQSAVIDGAAARVEFLRVSGDSRCPADAVCVWAGDALVQIRVIGSSTGEYELHTGDSSRAAVTHAGLRIELKQLQPYPSSARTIPPGEYRATLIVTR